MKRILLKLGFYIVVYSLHSMQSDNFLVVQDLTKLSESQINDLFGQTCTPHVKLIADVECLRTRRSHRSLEPSLIEGHFSNEDNENIELSLHVPAVLDTSYQDNVEESLVASPLNDYSTRLAHNLFSELSLPEKRNALLSVQNTLRTQHIVSQTNQLVPQVASTFSQLCEKSMSLLNTPIGKIAAVTSLGLLGASYKIHTTRSILDAAGDSAVGKVIELALGSAGGCIAVYLGWKEIARILHSARLITKMDKEFKEWVSKTKNLKRDIEQMSSTHEQLALKVNSVVSITHEVKEHLPSLVALSGDHDNLAGILQLVLVELKRVQKENVKMQECLVALGQSGKLSQDSQQELQEMIDASAQAGVAASKDQQKLKIVEKYNKEKQGIMGKLLKNTKPVLFDEIPREWFDKHKHWLEKHNYTVRPGLKD